jgi:hypothetical protein
MQPQSTLVEFIHLKFMRRSFDEGLRKLIIHNFTTPRDESCLRCIYSTVQYTVVLVDQQVKVKDKDKDKE